VSRYGKVMENSLLVPFAVYVFEVVAIYLGGPEIRPRGYRS